MDISLWRGQSFKKKRVPVLPGVRRTVLFIIGPHNSSFFNGIQDATDNNHCVLSLSNDFPLAAGPDTEGQGGFLYNCNQGSVWLAK